MNKYNISLLVIIMSILLISTLAFIGINYNKTQQLEYNYIFNDITAHIQINSLPIEIESSDIVSSIIETSSKFTTVKIPTGEYPEATLIWNILRSWDWTPETCAGIIGNMMAEVTGGDLDLSRWDLDDQWGFGLIQWTDGRRQAIKSRYGDLPTIEQQLEFMKDELFGTNNITKQVSQKNLDIIMNVNKEQTPESIAMCFASYYERCAKQHRAKRQRYARITYEYFINKYSEDNN